MKYYSEKIYKSDSKLLPKIEDYIIDSISKIKFKKGIKDNIELAIAEAAANSILHGNKNDPAKNVKITIDITDERLKLVFQDEGNGFDPAKVPDPTLPENLLKGSGRGLHIMRSLVDEVRYNFSDEGTELILVFNI